MSVSQLTVSLASEHDTQHLAQQLAKFMPCGCVWLSGDLGAGKTTLTRYWLQALGHIGSVKSPTYTLVEAYQIEQLSPQVSMANTQSKTVYHADLYRLQDPEELSFIGFDDYLADSEALVIIEWASRADDYLPVPHLFIDIEHQDNQHRQASLQVSKAGLAIGLDLQQFAL